MTIELPLAVEQMKGNTKSLSARIADVRDLHATFKYIFVQIMAFVFDPHRSDDRSMKDLAQLISIKDDGTFLAIF
jgi:hypothetical protein